MRQIVTDWVFFVLVIQFHMGFRITKAQRVFLIHDINLQQMRLALMSTCCRKTIFKIEVIIMEVCAG